MENSLKNQLKIARNIKLLRLHKGMTQEQAADMLGIASPRYANYEMGTRSIPIDILSELSSNFHIALDAIVKSDLSKVDLNSLMEARENRLLFPVLISENDNYQRIEVVPVKASAGYLIGYADPEFIEGLPSISSPYITKGGGRHRAFPIVGDSMLPIPDGSIVIGRMVEKLQDIKDGNTYIIVSEDGIVYKRVYSKLKDEKSLLLVSDNKYYAPYKVRAETIYEVWEYRGFFSDKIYKEDEYSPENLFFQMRDLSKNLGEFKEHFKSIS